MSTEGNKAIVRKFFELFADVNNRDAFRALIDEANFVYHDTMPNMAHDYSGLLALREVFVPAFPDQYTTVDDLVAEGDVVIARHTHHGTHLGPLMGMPPTGKRIAVQGIELIRVRDGKIVEFRRLDDDLGLFQQLGVIPGPGR